MVRGLCDGRAAAAHWHRGKLTASVDMMRQIQAVVDEGQWFGYDDGDIVESSIDGDYLAALLTVMRAFGHVANVELHHASDDRVAAARQQLRRVD